MVWSHTAKLNGLDPEAYLAHVLSVIAEYPVSKVDEQGFDLDLRINDF